MTIVFSRNSLDFSPKTSTFFRMELGSLMFKQEEDVIPVSMCFNNSKVYMQLDSVMYVTEL